MRYLLEFTHLRSLSLVTTCRLCRLSHPGQYLQLLARVKAGGARSLNFSITSLIYSRTCSAKQMATMKRKAEPLTASTSDLKKPKKDASLTSFFGAPKGASPSTKSAPSSSPTSPSEPPPVKFDKAKWVSTLSNEQKKLLKLEIETLDPSWLAHLREEVVHKDFLELKRFLQREVDSGKKLFPPLEEVYSWCVG